ncbi:hypothetical protein GCM10027610_044090 [Dactylosporangium cerinum]
MRPSPGGTTLTCGRLIVGVPGPHGRLEAPRPQQVHLPQADPHRPRQRRTGSSLVEHQDADALAGQRERGDESRGSRADGVEFMGGPVTRPLVQVPAIPRSVAGTGPAEFTTRPR